MRQSRLLGLTLVMILTFKPVAAFATEPATSGESPIAPPDIVLFKDGGLLRGTIVELHPNGTVIIKTLSGENRTFDMSQIRYAGPTVQAPSVPPAFQLFAPKTEPWVFSGERLAPLTFAAQNGTQQLTLHIHVGQFTVGSALGRRYTVNQYTRVCSAPCTTWLRPDLYHLALSANGGSPVGVSAPIRIEGKTELIGRYDSYETARAAGWWLFALSLIGGVISAIGLHDTAQQHPANDNRGYLTVGFGVSLLGAFTGMALGLSSDQAFVTAR
jgi:hypothetical protein